LRLRPFAMPCVAKAPPSFFVPSPAWDRGSDLTGEMVSGRRCRLTHLTGSAGSKKPARSIRAGCTPRSHSSHTRRRACLPPRGVPATFSGRWQAPRSNERVSKASVSRTAASSPFRTCRASPICRPAGGTFRRRTRSSISRRIRPRPGARDPGLAEPPSLTRPASRYRDKCGTSSQ